MYHEFDAEHGSSNYGNELDIAISHPLNVGNIGFVKSGSIELKYADYDAADVDSFTAAAGNVDTKKLWVTTNFKF